MIVPEINEITDFLKKAKRTQSVQTKTTGFPSIDKLGQYNLGGLTVIAGYPGMGVTAFMISSLINLTKLNLSCTYVSLKEPALSTIRLIAANLFQSEDFKSSKCSDMDFIKSIEGSALESLPIQICDNSNIYVSDLDFILGIRKQVGLEISKVFFIDDLDELKVGEGENIKDKFSLICMELKELAVRYQVALSLVTQ
jgi:replicative DNA helicase